MDTNTIAAASTPTSAPKVLLVDDDVELTVMLAEYLEQEGFSVATAHDGENGVAMALSQYPDILVLDVMMPRLGGIEVLRRVRRQSNVPVLMLTAAGDDIDRVIGLELGADDYVSKPCTSRELVARLRAILRRTQASLDQSAQVLTAGPLKVWPERRQAQLDGTPLALTGAEYNLLEVLVRHAGSVVSKDNLSQQGLGRSLTRFDRSIDVHVSSIRHKLGLNREGRSWIQTVRGLGYQLIRE